MLQLIANSNIYGPFHDITINEDHYYCDGQVLPFTVVGTDGEIAEWEGPLPSTPRDVPKEITMRQARLALLSAGKLAAVATAIAGMPEPMKSAANIEWEYSNTVLRHNGFVSQLGPLLGLTDDQIDDLFIAASKL